MKEKKHYLNTIGSQMMSMASKIALRLKKRSREKL